jgi:NitT/TauT family transport system ATP-binding protein
MSSPAEEKTAHRAAVTLEDVSFSYGDGHPVLDRFSCTIGRGEIVAVVGPSGCGKSTLLRLVSGLLVPSHGAVSVHTENLSGSRTVTMVFQEDVLLPWLNVRRNVGMSGAFMRLGKGEIGQRVDHLLALVGLSAYGHFYPRQLSGGMRRRIGVLQPLAAHPSVLLMDEPFSSIDEPTRILIHNDVRRLLKELGTTTVLVTHDLAEAVSLSDRVVIVSTRPSRVVRELPVELGEERNILELRQDPAYLEIYAQLWESLKREIGTDQSGTAEMRSAGER